MYNTILGLFLLAIMIIYVSRFVVDVRQRDMQFKIQIESAKAQKDVFISKMSYKDLIEIVNTNMNYYIDQAILTSGMVTKKSDEERSIGFNDLLVSICADVETSLSIPVREAIMNYVSEKHMKTYIKDTSRMLLIAKIERSRK